jgi:hypothetical protein
MLAHAETTLTNSQISEFLLEKEYTNYFHLQQAISELVEADLIEKQTVSNTSYYRITNDGESTLSYFQDEISSDIRKEIKDYLKSNGCEAQEKILTPADYYTTSQGSYAVRCQIIEKNARVLDLNLVVPNLEAAKFVCKNWPKKSQNIYGKIMEELF